MGFFSKVFKGVKKVFKKIGKGIKKVAGKVGKFMNKIGIVGQIAMAFILPGIGQALASTLGNVGTWAASALANPATSALVKGVAHVTNAAVKFAAGTGRVFKTVTSAVKNFTGEIGKTVLNKIPGINVENASSNIFGTGGAIEKAAAATGETWNTTVGSSKWWDGFARSPDNIPAGLTTVPEPIGTTSSPATGPADLTSSPIEMRQPPAGDYTTIDVVGQRVDPTTGFESGLPTDMPLDIPEVRFDKPSLLDRVKGESGVSIGSENVVSDVGTDYMITERSLAAAGTEAVKAVGQSLMAPEAPEYSYSGEVIVAQNAYDVSAGTQISQMPQIGYGAPMLQYDALYRPTSSYAQRMGVA
jgi:hypothetical protein